LLFQDLVHLLGRQLLTELRVDLVVPVQQGPHAGDAFLDVAAHVLRRIEPRLLREKPDGDARSGKRFADEIGVLTGHDAKQRALARPVQAEHANLRARQERQPDVLEDDVVGLVHFAQALHCVDVLHHSLIANIAKPASIANAQYSRLFERSPISRCQGCSNDGRSHSIKPF
jgi:hypothetical protein